MLDPRNYCDPTASCEALADNWFPAMAIAATGTFFIYYKLRTSGSDIDEAEVEEHKGKAPIGLSMSADADLKKDRHSYLRTDRRAACPNSWDRGPNWDRGVQRRGGVPRVNSLKRERASPPSFNTRSDQFLDTNIDAGVIGMGDHSLSKDNEEMMRRPPQLQHSPQGQMPHHQPPAMAHPNPADIGPAPPSSAMTSGTQIGVGGGQLPANNSHIMLTVENGSQVVIGRKADGPNSTVTYIDIY